MPPHLHLSNPRPSRGDVRVLVVFFSRAGENYFHGGRVDLEVGNTEVLAGFIADHLDDLGVDFDVHRLEAADPYPASIEGYDVVLVGSPVWNVRPPMLMHTFAEAHDFTGVAVHPFVTYAVSGLAGTEDEYATACPGAHVGPGLAMRGEAVRDDGPDAAATWLDRMDLLGQEK